jgi:hypothetical protein
MLEKQLSYDHNITELGHIQVRQITRIMEDGKEISRKPSPPETINPSKDSAAGRDTRTVLLMNELKGMSLEIPLITGQGSEKVITWDNSITEWGHVQVRRITRIFEDGKEVSKTYHRHVISPGDDITNEDVLSKLTAQAIHVPEIIAAYRAKITELNLKFE